MCASMVTLPCMEQWFPWEQQPNETGPAWAAFVAYRDLGPSRTLEAAAKTLRKHSTTLSEYGRKYEWEPRVRAWDAEVDRARRTAYLEMQVKMVGKHLRVAECIRKLAMQAIRSCEPQRLLQRPRDALAYLRAAVEIERSALGLPSMEPQNPNANARPADVYFDSLDKRELLMQTQSAAKVLDGQLQSGERDHAEPTSASKRSKQRGARKAR